MIQSRPRNKLLANLPDDEFARLQPNLKTISVNEKQVIYRVGAPMREVVFLNGGMASVTTVMQDGTVVETATVGDEGLLGMEVFLGGDIATGETMMQVPGTDAVTLSIAHFKAELERKGAFLDGVQRYSQALVALMMHSTACMALHDVQERCCRWLLMTHDRVHGDDFRLSQEFLATMLGSTRPTVSIVANTLQKAGFITYKHGHMRILDRQGLESGSCECYANVRAQYERLRI